MIRIHPTVAAVLVLVAACQKAQTAPLYEVLPVERRDIVVTASATGVIQPILTFSVKSKAWGEIIDMRVQTGDEVKKGQLLARIDPRIPRQNLTEALATLDKARAQLQTATAQLKRSEALYQSQSIAETEYDATKLSQAVAAAAVANAEASLQTANDAMEDTQVRAPITGSILQLNAVLGTVISSPTLGGGTVILKMASLDTVQDSAMVAETDIGRVQPGLPVTITVDAFPNRAFEGSVLKIGPQAQVVQNLTTFPVFVNIPNPGHVLKPGMNTDLRIHTGRRDGVLAVPTAALRTQRDMAAGAAVLGLDPQVVDQQVAAAQAASAPVPGPRTTGGTDTSAGRSTTQGAPGTLTTPNGRVITLPPGVTAEQVQAAIAKMRSGAEPTAAERALLAQVFGRMQRGGGRGGGEGGGGGRGARGSRGSGNSYIVFVRRAGKVIAVPIRTGLSDQDYIEVATGVTEKDTVLILPSASLVQAQQQFRQRFQNVTGGGLPGLRQQPSQAGGAR
ncbi:MAG TPA: efflux RND transporter periplasmic adaptor subunit [Gemmatimonadales bacterium]|nr:efflux RND transporter periplasmic adaptor subunit [Gemmatimonadales bacterium]